MITNIFINMLVTHIVGDFYLQCQTMSNIKICYGIKSMLLWLHALLMGVLAWLAWWQLDAWWVAIVGFVTHLMIDWAKSYMQVRLKIFEVSGNVVDKGRNNRYDVYIFLIDQLLHIGILWMIACIGSHMYSDWCNIDWLQNLWIEHPMRIKIVLAIFLASKPSNILILLIMNSCKINMDNNNHGNFHSGGIIGIAERSLMILFVVLGQYEAIGFLVAAKSILRFGESNSGDEKSEYVLTGTLLSLIIALVLGLAVITL